VTIVVRNTSAPLPQFDSTQFHSPYLLFVVEGRSQITLATFNAPKVSQDVCYYVVGKKPVHSKVSYI